MNNQIASVSARGIPEWESARQTIYPLIQPVTHNHTNLPARTTQDMLTEMLTSRIQMSIACLYQGNIIPLTDTLIRNWSISTAVIHKAMEENMAQFTHTSRFEEHEKDGFIYYTVHSNYPFFNSLLPFYKPMQKRIQSFLGVRFFFSVPERRTAVLFGEDQFPSYRSKLRDDVLLTCDCSGQALSRELISVSGNGIVSVCDGEY